VHLYSAVVAGGLEKCLREFGKVFEGYRFIGILNEGYRRLLVCHPSPSRIYYPFLLNTHTNRVISPNSLHLLNIFVVVLDTIQISFTLFMKMGPYPSFSCIIKALFTYI
jgi:hypothetical protein